MTVTIAVGVQKRPSTAPQDIPWASDYKITNEPSFTEAVSAISTLVLSYASSPAFFSIISEMRDPTKYSRSLYICQGTLTAIYITVGCVLYYYCGSYVASPALGSAGPLVKRVCYGLALPGLIVSTILFIHVCSLPRMMAGILHRLIIKYSFLENTSLSGSCEGQTT